MGIQGRLEGILEELRSALSVLGDAPGEELAEAVIGTQTVFVAGSGRSGLAMRSFAMRLMHLGLSAHVVGETTTPRITDRDLLVIGSGSGSTPSLVVHSERARSIGAAVALITIDADSPIAANADIVLPITAPSPKIAEDTGARSVQPMGSLFEQALLLILDAIVLVLMEKMGRDGRDDVCPACGPGVTGLGFTSLLIQPSARSVHQPFLAETLAPVEERPPGNALPEQVVQIFPQWNVSSQGGETLI